MADYTMQAGYNYLLLRYIDFKKVGFLL